ncbi:hypothetical protein J4G65_19440, partial [Aeromonas allosaccharophila]|uniref:hypothetical protein n=1 Tax=Aeromonas allosaccharophila TaxID=656 RepID=UPI001BD039B9
MVEIAGYLALSWQVKTKHWLFNTLKTPKPGRETGLWCWFWCANLWVLWAKLPTEKKAFPV